MTTRTEFYDSPGALPTVERAALREDLRRRDFTINAMAASLKPADFGRLVDPYDGRSDLEARVLRVLHNLSFIDDPTRIFRGIRYEARYGLRFDDHTTSLARVEMGLVGDLSSVRLRDELVQLLEDPGAPGGIAGSGSWASTGPSIRICEATGKRPRCSTARALRDELQVEAPLWRLGVAVLARDMTSNEALDWLERLKIRRRDIDRIVGAVTVGPRIVERLREEWLDPAQVVALADPFARMPPLLALAREEQPALRDYFTRLRP